MFIIIVIVVRVEVSRGAWFDSHNLVWSFPRPGNEAHGVETRSSVESDEWIVLILGFQVPFAYTVICRIQREAIYKKIIINM